MHTTAFGARLTRLVFLIGGVIALAHAVASAATIARGHVAAWIERATGEPAADRLVVELLSL
eukprot:3295986-Prymnesium_polylepis.1